MPSRGGGGDSDVIEVVGSEGERMIGIWIAGSPGIGRTGNQSKGWCTI